MRSNYSFHLWKSHLTWQRLGISLSQRHIRYLGFALKQGEGGMLVEFLRLSHQKSLCSEPSASKQLKGCQGRGLKSRQLDFARQDEQRSSNNCQKPNQCQTLPRTVTKTAQDFSAVINSWWNCCALKTLAQLKICGIALTM